MTDAVLQTSTRWRSLSLDCPIGLFRTHLPFALPLLEAFSITMRPVPIADSVAPVTCFSVCPRLRSVTVTHCDRPPCQKVQLRRPSSLMDTVALPWDQVMDLTTDTDGALYLSPAIGAHHLRRFTFRGSSLSLHAYLPGAPRALASPSVRELVLDGVPSYYVSHIFESYEFPSLVSLTMDCLPDSFGPTTAPSLEVLTLKSLVGTEPETALLQLLQCTPKLKRLEVVAHGYTPVLFEPLSSDAGCVKDFLH
jgi:hypothetical protein